MKCHRDLLLLALDPSRILNAQRLEPDSWQRRLLFDPGRQVLLNCSRQSGKSRTVAALAIHTALFRPGSLTLLVSPSLRQSTELFRKVLDGYQAAGPARRRAIRQPDAAGMANQSRVICLPGREDTIRSFDGVALLAIDEAARVPRRSLPGSSADAGRVARPLGLPKHAVWPPRLLPPRMGKRRQRLAARPRPLDRMPRASRRRLSSRNAGRSATAGFARNTNVPSRRWRV